MCGSSWNWAAGCKPSPGACPSCWPCGCCTTTRGPHRCLKTSGTCDNPGAAVSWPITAGKPRGTPPATRGLNATLCALQNRYGSRPPPPDGTGGRPDHHGGLLGCRLAATSPKLLVRRHHHPQPAPGVDVGRDRQRRRPGGRGTAAGTLLAPARPSPTTALHHGRLTFWERQRIRPKAPDQRLYTRRHQPGHLVLDRPAPIHFPDHVARRLLLPGP